MKNTLLIACRCLVLAGWSFSLQAAAEEGDGDDVVAYTDSSAATTSVAFQSSAVQAPETMPAERNDPFQVSSLMRQRAYLQSQGGMQFVAAPNAKTPTMTLKGLVNKNLALLEIQGVGTYMVRQGDSLSFNKGGENLVIKIEKIDSLSLNVKVGTLQEVIVVR